MTLGACPRALFLKGAGQVFARSAVGYVRSTFGRHLVWACVGYVLADAGGNAGRLGRLILLRKSRNFMAHLPPLAAVFELDQTDLTPVPSSRRTPSNRRPVPSPSSAVASTIACRWSSNLMSLVKRPGAAPRSRIRILAMALGEPPQAARY